MTLGSRLIPMLVVLLGPAVARAEPYEGTRALAMGGALRAAAVSTPALYLNPAGLAVGRLYHLEAAYQYQDALAAHLASASVVDSTNKLAGGLGATYSVSDPDHADRTAYDVRLGLALPIAQGFSFGGTVKYLRLEQEGVPLHGAAAAADPDEPLLDDFTFDAGVLLALGNFLRIGAAAYNLTNLDTPEAPLEVGFGGAVSLAELAVIDADVVIDLTTYDEAALRWGVGGEYFAANRYPLRIGYAMDPEREEQWISGGLGYVDQRFSADLSLRQRIVGGSDTTVAFGLKFFVH